MEPRRQQRGERYPVVFQAGPGPSAAGALVVDCDCLTLEGRTPHGHIEVNVPYGELMEVRIGRSAEERLNGRPGLLLERTEGPRVQVEPLGRRSAA